MDHYPDHLAQPPHWNSQAENQGNGKPLSFYLLVRVAGKVLQPRRLSAAPELGPFSGVVDHPIEKLRWRCSTDFDNWRVHSSDKRQASERSCRARRVVREGGHACFSSAVTSRAGRM